MMLPIRNQILYSPRRSATAGCIQRLADTAGPVSLAHYATSSRRPRSVRCVAMLAIPAVVSYSALRDTRYR